MITKKDIIAIADAIKEHNKDIDVSDWNFNNFHLLTIANVLGRINPSFNRRRFLDYIHGRCGPNGDRR